MTCLQASVWVPCKNSILAGDGASNVFERFALGIHTEPEFENTAEGIKNPNSQQGRGPHLMTEHFWLQLFRSVAGSACQLLFFIAVQSIPLLDSVLLSNGAPLFFPWSSMFGFARRCSRLCG